MLYNACYCLPRLYFFPALRHGNTEIVPLLRTRACSTPRLHGFVRECVVQQLRRCPEAYQDYVMDSSCELGES